jgi:hypothetical protein
MTDERIDMTKLRVAFRDFAKAPKNLRTLHTSAIFNNRYIMSFCHVTDADGVASYQARRCNGNNLRLD